MKNKSHFLKKRHLYPLFLRPYVQGQEETSIFGRACIEMTANVMINKAKLFWQTRIEANGRILTNNNLHSFVLTQKYSWIVIWRNNLKIWWIPYLLKKNAFKIFNFFLKLTGLYFLSNSKQQSSGKSYFIICMYVRSDTMKPIDDTRLS